MTTPVMTHASWWPFSSPYHCYEQAAKKGTAYLNALMYSIHELESAISKCPGNKDDSVHAWDEGCARAVVIVVALLLWRCCCGPITRPSPADYD